MNIVRIGLDLAKYVFHLHGVDERGKVVLRKTLRRPGVAPFFANLPRCVVGMEASNGAHYWAKTLSEFGHDVRLISPQFVTPYVKSNKNDRNDAEAICEAVGRPNLAYAVRCQYDESVIICRSGLRGFPTTLPDFQRVFPDDAACAAYLERLRWPDGFTCPKCKKLDEPYRFAKRTSVVLRCRACHVNTSLTATTVMQSSHMPLSVWFWGAYLVTTQTPGQSALQFQRQLGLKRYETAFQMLHKLRAGLVRPERDTIGDQYPVEVDESFVGGRTKGEGRGVHHKAIVIGAIEVRPRKAPVKGARRTFYAGRLRLRLVPNREAKSLTKFVRENVAKGAVVHTDGWTGYDDLEALGYVHKPLVIDGDPERIEAHLPMIHIAFSNLKSWLLGTHHGVSHCTAGIPQRICVPIQPTFLSDDSF